MRITRRQVLKLAAAHGVLLSLPRAARAVVKVAPGDGFVAAARFGDHLAVAITTASAARIDFFSPDTGARTRRAISIPEPLRIGGLAVFAGTMHVGGHVLVEGPPVELEAGDYRDVMEPGDEDDPGFADFPTGGTIVVRSYDLIPWVAAVEPDGAELGPVTRFEDHRGVVRGFTPHTGDVAVWIAECPEGTNFSALAVRAFRRSDRTEIAGLSLGTDDVDVASVLSVSDGTGAILASNDHGLPRFWEVSGETLTELRLPDEGVRRAVVQMFLVGSTYHVITADREDGTVRQWKRSGSHWAAVESPERNLVATGNVDLEMSNA
ncbi:MAG: hypothetical protein ACR2JP_06105 [Acidimicrobiia bacterium]